MDAQKTNVGVLCADGANRRERFYVDFIPGRTNIISLKKLKREAGEAVSDDSSDENEKEAEKYIFVKRPRKKGSDAMAMPEKVQHKKRGKKVLDNATENRMFIKGNSKSKSLKLHNDDCKRDFHMRMKTPGGVLIIKKHYQPSDKLNRGKSISFTSAAHQLHCRSSTRSSIKQPSKIEINELPPTRHALGTASLNLTGKLKLRNEMLHLSILQLKMLVEHSKTPLLDVQGADASSPNKTFHLSLELKDKLKKIAKWTELNEGKISEELIDRLMNILGKYLERTNLKKILREMILEELYASQANCNNFKQIKMEFIKLIRLQASSSKLKVPAPGHTKGTYSMGYLLEEKLCDLYDTFIQGLDEDSGSSVVRRLFAKLADLWPEGTMDMHEIRQAICRAKERRVIPSTQ